jgi:hypothetical protein
VPLSYLVSESNIEKKQGAQMKVPLRFSFTFQLSISSFLVLIDRAPIGWASASPKRGVEPGRFQKVSTLHVLPHCTTLMEFPLAGVRNRKPVIAASFVPGASRHGAAWKAGTDGQRGITKGSGFPLPPQEAVTSAWK